jgi:hypothetical protein
MFYIILKRRFSILSCCAELASRRIVSFPSPPLLFPIVDEALLLNIYSYFIKINAYGNINILGILGHIKTNRRMIMIFKEI